MSFRLCSRAPLIAIDSPLPVRRVARHRDRQRARKILAGQRCRDSRGSRSGVPLRHQFAAQPPRARAQIDHVIGALDGLRIVLHHQHRVAHVAQRGQRVEQPLVVARMQADRRLVEHVQHAAQLRADLRRQPDALRFAAG